MTSHPLQNSFARGVLAPELHARVDLDQYRLALADALNMLPLRQGALTRRPGFQYAGMGKSQVEADVTQVLPFVFSKSQAYAIELGNLYARLFAQGGQVMDDGDPYEIVTPWTRAQALELNTAQSGDVIYAVHGDVPPRKIQRNGETDWTIVDDEAADGPYLDIPATRTILTPSARGRLLPGTASASSTESGTGVGSIFDEDPATYWQADNTDNPQWVRMDMVTSKRVVGYSIGADLESDGFAAPRSWTFEGSADDTNWVALDSRFGETGWANGERRYYTYVNETSYRYYRIYITDKNHNASPTEDEDNDDGSAVRIADIGLQGAGNDTVFITLTASSTSGINDGTGFVTSDIGRHLRFFTEDATWAWFKIATRVSSTQITASLHSPPLPSVKASTTWRLGAFSATTGYPQLVCFFKGRKVFARTTYQPRTIWMTRSGTFDDFSDSIPAQADDAVTITLPEGIINWIADLGSLVIGTENALRSLGPADRTQAFSATNYDFGKPYWAGFEKMAPVRCGETLLALGLFSTALREVSESPNTVASYVAPEASILSDHLLFPGVTWMAYTQDPISVVWLGLDDGTFASITYEREQQMISYAPHAVGGDGFVERACAIPGDGRSELWATVWRDGVGRTVERMATIFRNQNAPDAFFVDCGLAYDGWNADPAHTVTIDGSGYTANQTGHVTSNGFNLFVLAGPVDVGRELLIGYGNGSGLARVRVTEVNGPTNADVLFLTDIPAELREVATDEFAITAETIDGADHLDDETVTLWADGGYEDDVEVEDGEFTIPSGQPAGKVAFGFDYRSWFKTLRWPAGERGGPPLGGRKRPVSLVLDVINTALAKARAVGSADWVDILLRNFNDAQDIAIPLVTGTSDETHIDASWSASQGQIEVESVKAGPLTVRAIQPKMDFEP